MRKKTTTLLLLLCIASATLAYFYAPLAKRLIANVGPKPAGREEISEERTKLLLTKASLIHHYALANGYDTTISFLIDMKQHSGQPRFYVMNTEKLEAISNGLVTHGRCNEDWLEGRRYNNNVGGGCTSLGRYRIGASYYGRFGLAYKLHGLDSSNSNAYKRYVVLHSHDCVPSSATTEEICQSDGCPTVSPSFLKELQAIIKKSKKPILLWIYE